MAVDWAPPPDDLDQLKIEQRINDLREEHRALDGAIQAFQQQAPYDQLGLMRLKRRKLALRDQIRACENMLTPDIIA